jgi:membrane-bound lytic murein transglycosylase A
MTDPDALLRSCDMSIAYLQRPSSRRYYPYLDITHERALASVNALKAIVLQEKASPQGPQWHNGIIRQLFEVYQSKGAPAPEGGYSNKVLFTGYFTPIYDASLTREGPFQYPLYKRPADLKVNPQTGEVVEKYLTRRQIESSEHLVGQEIAFVKTRWEAYVITIQGSARLRLPDGAMMEIGWDGYNGYDYSSPAEAMVKDGVITKAQHSAKGMKAFFDQNPHLMDQYLWKNDRYVFFKQTTGGPYGALNVPVTPFASIAVDKKIDPVRNIYPRAMPAFLAVPVPMDESGATRDFRGFMMDQDTGGAIRAAGRCDLYMGVGSQAGRLAGHQLHEGALYYIALKPQYIAQYLPPTSAKVAPAAPPAAENTSEAEPQ